MKKIIIKTNVERLANLSMEIDVLSYKEKFTGDYEHNLVCTNFHKIKLENKDAEILNETIISIVINIEDDNRDDFRYLMEAIEIKLEKEEYEIIEDNLCKCD